MVDIMNIAEETTNTSVLSRWSASKRLIGDAAFAYRLLVFTVRELKKIVNDLHIVKPTIPTPVTFRLQFEWPYLCSIMTSANLCTELGRFKEAKVSLNVR